MRFARWRGSMAVLSAAAWAAVAGLSLSAPDFLIPGHEEEARRLGRWMELHLPGARTACTLWDPWLPMSSLWVPAGGAGAGPDARAFYRDVLLRRPIDADGYVSMQQHRGMAHSEGWPFPAWQQSTGIGWHFSVAGDGWAVQNFRQQALTSTDGWTIVGAEVEGIDTVSGLSLRATADTVTLTTPGFSCGTVVAPFIRVEWGAEGARPGESRLQWRLEGEEDWPTGRSVAVHAHHSGPGLGFSNVPVHDHPGFGGTLVQLRLVLPGGPGARITLKSIITAIDTRHPVTNSAFIQAATEYFNWTTDVEFLRERLPELRRALAYALEEFDVRAGFHVRVPWPGHDGRSGLARDAAGRRVLRPGLGVGNNYWDLLPFGGHDAFATMQLAVALRRWAELERALGEHPEWGIAAAGGETSAAALEALADSVRDDFRTRFWNEETGRFVGWIDLQGGRHDFGFTFLNTEAIHHGLATPEQEMALFDWLDGRRLVAGDTSQGADIFRWRFGPRSTTRRNTENYVWVWSNPESIAWGDQVQDGGAVLGFTYFELMARLRVQGPDRAWQRLREVLAWFGEVQAEGGYRGYYATPGRGTLQGGGPPGGLGFDHEFLESILVPQVMLYGFLGAQPRPGGLSLSPRLPTDWPSVTIDGVQIHDHVFAIAAEAQAVTLTSRSPGKSEVALWLPGDDWFVDGQAPVPAGAIRAASAPTWRGSWVAGQSRRFHRR